MIDLTNKVAIVTGGNSGIGYASARGLSEAGATVVITGRNSDKVNSAAKELGCMGITADVYDLAAIDELVATVKREFGSVDILFVNAGVFAPAPVGSVTEELFDQTMGINFKGAVFTIEKFIPILNEGSSIINLSSINAYTGMAMTAIYAASKAALNSYTRTAATELAPMRIRVNAINPGPIETPIFGKTGMTDEEIAGFGEMILNSVPLKRFGKPEEIANLVVFLASEQASFITGSEYNIDGGLNINPVLRQ